MNSLNISGKVDDGGNNMKDYKFVNADFEGSMSVPIQFLTSEGRGQIGEAFSKFGENTIQAEKNIYEVSPIGVSRSIEQRTGQKPDLGFGSYSKSEIGKDFSPNSKTDLYEEDLGGGEKKLIGDGSIAPHGIMYKNSDGKLVFNQYDSNPVFKLLSFAVPGFASFGNTHDSDVSTKVIPAQYKEESIPLWIPYNYYGAVGTLIDVPNWNLTNKMMENDAKNNNTSSAAK